MQYELMGKFNKLRLISGGNPNLTLCNRVPIPSTILGFSHYYNKKNLNREDFLPFLLYFINIYGTFVNVSLKGLSHEF